MPRDPQEHTYDPGQTIPPEQMAEIQRIAQESYRQWTNTPIIIEPPATPQAVPVSREQRLICNDCDYVFPFLVSDERGPFRCPTCGTLCRPQDRPAIAICSRCHVPQTEAVLSIHTDHNRRNRLLCEECILAVRREELIHGHSWVPDVYRVIRGKNDYKDRLLYGIELEINTRIEMSVHASRFKKWLDNQGMGGLFFFKRDGSLSTGYEIVSMPMTLKAWHDVVNWRKICAYLHDTGATSEQSGECGLHIHASREALTQRDIGKLKYFYYANRVQIHKLSRRTNYRYCAIECHSPHDKMWYGNKTRHLTHYPNNGDRYVAVNVHTGKPTVEFRVMRGTLDHRRIKASLQFTDAVIHFCKDHGVLSTDTIYVWRVFKKWAKETARYNHLVQYLEKEGIK